MKLLDNAIHLSYPLPNGKTVKLNLATEELLGARMNKNVKRLLGCYEQDMLFLNKEIEGDIQQHLDERYGRDKSKKALDELRTLEAVVFAPISSQLDKVDFSVSAEQLKSFFGIQLDEEFGRLKNGEFDPTLSYILNDPNGQALMRSLLTQFSIEFLIEGAPMGLYATGAFGTLQSHLLRVYQDEMGNGVPEDKHSHLYEKTMVDLGLSDTPDAYQDHFLTSNMLVSAYTYQICHDKSKFLRYLGAFFRNEACFIVWQKQLGESVREIYSGKVDCHYFDVHTSVDQAHGRWVLDNLISHALDRFGDDAAPHILRGFVELMIYQDIFGLELDHQILTGTTADSTELTSSDLKLSNHVASGQTEHLFSAQELLINLQGDGKLFLTDPLAASTSSEHGLIRLPPFTAAHIKAGNNGAYYN
ncbi:iron-containing redox enzyme family protein [Pseudomonas gingeri NCPPB 3146 = LMG 5327]|uniref:Iron-containing redox enzyme family protein n=3 Tax=Gammaproteobacteria TaxID=1236 RepID=A0A7Y8CG60_9PSED|nr:MULTISPECIES: iron-containing redox enzyme family protein [Pseudomonas]NVZ27724.1 iron-containing redox enzyme family protein [Pseudomonas gingeri]NVZ64161.1 iron-containing redox enzyme family protein [Pseudomonas gingeri]NVZ73289.1 iron-containing redox enzyme family protein [Pseudomonas gingeri]NWA05719.1 iron-containing redox enzyme family protein [Pseudomonas gingeri]NWC17548.1 iron-containing redox enzyme family protein [Pseudomonas gingeri]